MKNNKELCKIILECEKWRTSAVLLKAYQTFGMCIMLIGLLLYLLSDLIFFKIFTFLGILFTLSILIYFSIYIEPRWSKALKQYQKVVSELTSENREKNNNSI